MSYQVLARKWRPKNFAEMVGQAHVLKALINALDSQRLHHAYLFTGTRGVGKTTIARIMAKCLNCEQGVSSRPCGQCSICREVDEGRFVDLIEVDAASKTKVEDTRELLDNVQYMPSRGRYKVYLIDEVHMLSTSSFNALLKTLEEPPSYVKFLLATTDPQKLPPTILSRCLQFSLKNMQPEPIVGHLSDVLSAEQIPFDTDALWLLGRAANGSMRDAMSLTDQAVAFGQGQVRAEDVRAMLGSIDQGHTYRILQALLQGDGAQLLQAIGQLADQGPDWAMALSELLSILHRAAVAQLVPDAIDNGQGDREQILAIAQTVPAEDLQFYYQVGLIGQRDLPLAPDGRSGFEMVLLRMLAFRPAALAHQPSVTLVTAADRVDPSAEKKTEKNTLGVSLSSQPQAEISGEPAPWEDVPQPSAAPAAEPVAATWVAPEPLAQLASEDTEADSETDEIDDSTLDSYAYLMDIHQHYADLQQSEAQQAPVGAVADEVLAEDLRLQIPSASGVAAEWLEIYPQLELAGMTASIAANCALIEKTAEHWLMHIEQGRSSLLNANQQQRIEQAISDWLGQKIQLVIEKQPEQEVETPALAELRRKAQAQHQAHQEILKDPIVVQLMEQFGATIVPQTVEPI